MPLKFSAWQRLAKMHRKRHDMTAMLWQAQCVVRQWYENVLFSTRQMKPRAIRVTRHRPIPPIGKWLIVYRTWTEP